MKAICPFPSDPPGGEVSTLLREACLRSVGRYAGFVDNIIQFPDDVPPVPAIVTPGEDFLYVPAGTIFLDEVLPGDLFPGGYLSLPISARPLSGGRLHPDKELCDAIRRRRGIAKSPMSLSVEDTLLPLRMGVSFPWELFSTDGGDDLFPRNPAYWAKAVAIEAYYDLLSTPPTLSAGRVDLRRGGAERLREALYGCAYPVLHVGGFLPGEGELQPYVREMVLDVLYSFIGDMG